MLLTGEKTDLGQKMMGLSKLSKNVLIFKLRYTEVDALRQFYVFNHEQ